MQYKDFKGLKLSALGMGCMRLPLLDPETKEVDVKQTAEMVEYAMKNGINYYDTAWGYHGGKSESIMGEYYYLNTVEDGDNYVISGYVPAFLNGERVNLILHFDSERPYGYIAGALKVYTDNESDTQAKMLIAIGKGDRIQFVCDYYDYDGNYRDTYKLGDLMTLGDEVEIVNSPISSDLSKCRVTYRFTDLYQQHYWTPAVQ